MPIPRSDGLAMCWRILIVTLNIRYVGNVVHVGFGEDAPEGSFIAIFRGELQFHQKMTRGANGIEVYHENGSTVIADEAIISHKGKATIILTGRNGHWLALQDVVIN